MSNLHPCNKTIKKINMLQKIYISEGSCDTEDWSKNSALITEIYDNLISIQIINSNTRGSHTFKHLINGSINTSELIFFPHITVEYETVPLSDALKKISTIFLIFILQAKST